MSNSKLEETVTAVDRIIVKHGSAHPEVLADLVQLRTQLLTSIKQHEHAKTRTLLMRLAVLAKFLWDSLPPPDQ